MKKTIAGTAAAVAAVITIAGLTSCAASEPVPVTTAGAAETTSGSAETTSGSAETTSARPNATDAEISARAAGAGDVKGACQLFNTLYADYKAVSVNDVNAYEDIYFVSEEAKKTAPKAVYGLFAALSLIAIDHSGSAGSGEGPEQASKDTVRDQVFAAAPACTAVDVTLRL
ncbi:hypothetical protein [Arthrobacter rhizosphaerae]|uniref:hypothetical protein n=1 Tax=Arthrobacter rhizosphaerae TaxID=2855490 RepID=UPI001FF58E52|nr:hypothetical protein [Arthrobacter rhizosphaerae]